MHANQLLLARTDIVFLRAWYSIEPRKLYNPVTSLLLGDKSTWQGMRLTGQVRYEEGLKTPNIADSAYRVSTLAWLELIAFLRLIDPSASPIHSPLHERQGDSMRSRSPETYKRVFPMPPSPRSPNRNATRRTCNRVPLLWSQRRLEPWPFCSRSKHYEKIKAQGVTPRRRSSVSSTLKRSRSWTLPRWTSARTSVEISYVLPVSSRRGARKTRVGGRASGNARRRILRCLCARIALYSSRSHRYHTNVRDTGFVQRVYYFQCACRPPPES